MGIPEGTANEREGRAEVGAGCRERRGGGKKEGTWETNTMSVTMSYRALSHIGVHCPQGF